MNNDRRRELQKLERKFIDNIDDCHDKYHEVQKALKKQFNEEIYGIHYDYREKLEKLVRELNEANQDESEEQSCTNQTSNEK